MENRCAAEAQEGGLQTLCSFPDLCNLLLHDSDSLRPGRITKSFSLTSCKLDHYVSHSYFVDPNNFYLASERHPGRQQ